LRTAIATQIWHVIESRSSEHRAVQVINAMNGVHCLAWNQKQTILGIGQSPAMQFYKVVEPLQVVAYRRIRQREINIGGDGKPFPVTLKSDDGVRKGSRKLAQLQKTNAAKKPDWDVLQARNSLLHAPAHVGCLVIVRGGMTNVWRLPTANE
jgi:hypothetical protein